MSTNDTATYMIEIASSAQPFRVSLVWTDYPASESAAPALVNNLDLKVTAPNSSLYRGNVFSGGWSQTGGSGDSLNNVENVYIQSPATGVWTVAVSGTSVSNGPQPFALVLDGDFSPLAAPSIAIAIDSNDATDVVLSWPNSLAIDYYEVWQGQNPYLTAGNAGATLATVATTSDPVSYIDDNAAGNPAQNRFYVVHSVSILGQTSTGSSRKSVFTFGLTPGSPIP
ncbi:MAG: hypothetical protein GY759_09315 [Chloroflexi bacterium]|nr:hypothetical protein [Chloroflexota bacterium]